MITPFNYKLRDINEVKIIYDDNHIRSNNNNKRKISSISKDDVDIQLNLNTNKKMMLEKQREENSNSDCDNYDYVHGEIQNFIGQNLKRGQIYCANTFLNIDRHPIPESYVQNLAKAQITLDQMPLLFSIKNLLNPIESEELLNIAKNELDWTNAKDLQTTRTEKVSTQEIAINSGVGFLNLHKNLTFKCLVERVNTLFVNSLDPQRYDHNKLAFTTKIKRYLVDNGSSLMALTPHIDSSISTCVCYLNTVPKGQGGETVFPHMNELSFAPIAGHGIFFKSENYFQRNNENGTPTAVLFETAIHGSYPLFSDKYIIQFTLNRSSDDPKNDKIYNNNTEFYSLHRLHTVPPSINISNIECPLNFAQRGLNKSKNLSSSLRKNNDDNNKILEIERVNNSNTWRNFLKNKNIKNSIIHLQKVHQYDNKSNIVYDHDVDHGVDNQCKKLISNDLTFDYFQVLRLSLHDTHLKSIMAMTEYSYLSKQVFPTLVYFNQFFNNIECSQLIKSLQNYTHWSQNTMIVKSKSESKIISLHCETANKFNITAENSKFFWNWQLIINRVIRILYPEYNVSTIEKERKRLTSEVCFRFLRYRSYNSDPIKNDSEDKEKENKDKEATSTSTLTPTRTPVIMQEQYHHYQSDSSLVVYLNSIPFTMQKMSSFIFAAEPIYPQAGAAVYSENVDTITYNNQKIDNFINPYAMYSNFPQSYYHEDQDHDPYPNYDFVKYILIFERNLNSSKTKIKWNQSEVNNNIAI
jgi:hypothetical protein